MSKFFDANNKITNMVTSNGDIVKLEINGKDALSSNLEDNKTATINVSTYTSPVEITPTSGKNGMKKATVTLSNIPSGDALELDDFLLSSIPNGAKVNVSIEKIDGSENETEYLGYFTRDTSVEWDTQYRAFLEEKTGYTNGTYEICGKLGNEYIGFNYVGG